MKGFKIARIFGIDIELHVSWLIILFFLTLNLSTGYFPLKIPGEPAYYHWSLGFISAILLFASLVFHELAHSLIAKRFGIPVGKITLFILGGVAWLVEEPKRAKEDFLMAAAGPLSSIALAGFFLLLSILIGDYSALITAVLWLLIFMNTALAVFNLLPGFPLDGGRMFRAILWRRFKDRQRATIIASICGQFLGGALMGWGAMTVITGDFGGLWIILVGWFLLSTAGQARKMAKQDQTKG